MHEAFAQKDNTNKDNRVLGNVFAGYSFTPAISFKSNLGFNVHQWSYGGISPAYPEQAEATFTTGFNENSNQTLNWSWSNTARYVKALGQHSLDFLVGQEANAGTERFLNASIANLLSTDINSRYIQDALGDASTKNVTSSGNKSALMSLFGKLDYNFSDRYVASVTVRRDGSSRLAPGHQWGTFPAFGLGWRLSNEPFMANNRIFSDVMIRYGWGKTGNQLIPPGRIVTQLGGSRGDTYYDVSGGNALAGGYRVTRVGNSELRWEENKSQNLGADMVLFGGRINFLVDVYKRSSNNLLFSPSVPGAAGLS